MLHSSFFTRSMVFAYIAQAQLPFVLFRTFLTIRQDSLNVTVCTIARTSYQGYFIHSLSTLYYYNAPSLATRLTGDYRDRTCTGKCGPASLDTRNKTRGDSFSPLFILSKSLLYISPAILSLLHSGMEKLSHIPAYDNRSEASSPLPSSYPD